MDLCLSLFLFGLMQDNFYSAIAKSGDYVYLCINVKQINHGKGREKPIAD